MTDIPADFSWDQQTYAFWGTVDYASVRNLSGYHPSPRDDLEGLACTLLEMATGETAEYACITESGRL